MRPSVLFLTASYPTADAPTNGVFVREHARAAARHAEVALVHLHRCDGLRGAWSVVRVPDEAVPTWRVDYPRRPLALSYVGNLGAAILGYRAVRRAGFRPELLHANFFLAAVPAVVLGFATRLPVVTTEHWSVFLPGDPMRLGRLSLALARFAFRRSAVVLPVSTALGEAIRELGVEGPFRVVPNAVDTELFRPPGGRAEPDGRLLTVSGLYGAKGFEFLLPAVARLREQGLDVRLDVVGDGAERASYERITAELGLAGAVVFHGWRPKSEVVRFMQDADLFVLASVYENNPCAVLEALVTGLPVVATRVGGVPEVVGPGRGLLAEPRDPDDLATRVADALADEAFDREAIAAGAAAEYGLDAVGSALAEVYADVLGG